jgi:hypothetical protein
VNTHISMRRVNSCCQTVASLTCCASELLCCVLTRRLAYLQDMSRCSLHHALHFVLLATVIEATTINAENHAARLKRYTAVLPKRLGSRFTSLPPLITLRSRMFTFSTAQKSSKSRNVHKCTFGVLYHW